MRKLMPFIFLIGLYAYAFETDQITSIHTPAFTIFSYVVAILMCASFLVDIKKAKISNSNAQ